MCFSGLYSSLVLPLFFSAFEDRSRARRKARHSGGSREREREGRKRGKDPSDQKLLLSVRERAPLLSSAPRCFKKKKTPAPFFSFVALFQHCAIYAPIAPFPPSPQPGEGAASISSSQCGRKQRPCDAHEGEPGVAISSFAEGLAFFFFLPWFSLSLSLPFFLKKKERTKFTCQHLLGKQPGLRPRGLQRRRGHDVGADARRSSGRGRRARRRRARGRWSRGRRRRR